MSLRPSVSTPDDIPSPEMHAPLRRRGVVSRDMCGDMAVAMTIMIVTGAAFAAVPFADMNKPVDGFTTASDPLTLVATGFLTGSITAEALRQGDYFRFDQLLETWGAVRGVVWRFALVLMSLIAVFYAFGISAQFPRPWLLSWGVIAAGGLVVGRFVTAGVIRSLTREGRGLCRNIVVIGEGGLADAFIRRASEKESGMRVVGRFSADAFMDESGQALRDTQALCEANQLDDIVLCTPAQDGERSAAMMRRLSMLPVHVSLCPDAQWLDRGTAQLYSIGSVPLLTLHKRPLAGWANFTKWVEDKVIAALGLLLVSPIMLLCALAIRIEGGGPIFFVQHRQGFAGEIFPIVKFRTMRVMEDGEAVRQASKDDERVTQVGRFLRRYSLDELPQLWNVLQGHMSLVGPRPHALAHDKYYVDAISDYAARHKVKPGITGWAQVNGFRGETRDDETMAKRIRYDLDYIENWSLWFDMRILVMTVAAVILPKNAY